MLLRWMRPSSLHAFLGDFDWYQRFRGDDASGGSLSRHRATIAQNTVCGVVLWRMSLSISAGRGFPEISRRIFAEGESERGILIKNRGDVRAKFLSMGWSDFRALAYEVKAGLTLLDRFISTITSWVSTLYSPWHVDFRCTQLRKVC